LTDVSFIAGSIERDLVDATLAGKLVWKKTGWEEKVGDKIGQVYYAVFPDDIGVTVEYADMPDKDKVRFTDGRKKAITGWFWLPSTIVHTVVFNSEGLGTAVKALRHLCGEDSMVVSSLPLFSAKLGHSQEEEL
jgi:hypothetical protein